MRAARASSAPSPRGGRYDDLVKRFTGQEDRPRHRQSPIGVDRLLAALHAKGIGSEGGGGPGGRHRDGPRTGWRDYQAMAAELRAAGIRAEVYLGKHRRILATS